MLGKVNKKSNKESLIQSTVKFIWHKGTKFQHLRPITQVYGVCFDRSGRILIIREPNKLWNIPGGKPEIHETVLWALKRELREEADVTISDKQMIGYFEVVSGHSTIYQLRYACLIETIRDQSLDPTSNATNERKFVKQKDFFDFVNIADYKPMIEEAIKWFKRRQS